MLIGGKGWRAYHLRLSKSGSSMIAFPNIVEGDLAPCDALSLLGIEILLRCAINGTPYEECPTRNCSSMTV